MRSLLRLIKVAVQLRTLNEVFSRPRLIKVAVQDLWRGCSRSLRDLLDDRGCLRSVSEDSDRCSRPLKGLFKAYALRSRSKTFLRELFKELCFRTVL